MRIGHPKDFSAGVMFVIFGAAAAILSLEYQIGTAAKMGPGYFPFALGLFLILLGLGVMAKSLSREEPKTPGPSFRLKPLTLILSSVILFSFLLRPLGLLAATVLLVLLSSAAGEDFRAKEALLNSAVLVGIVLLVFVFFLEFQVPVWPSILAGRA